MIIDAHAHLDPHEMTREDYVCLMDASGIDKTILLASLNGPIPPMPDWQISIMRFLLLSPLHSTGRRIYESLIKNGRLSAGGKEIEIIHTRS